MKKLLAAAALAGLSTTSALAADMAVKAPMYVKAAPAFSWTGFYVGGNLGYSRTTTNFDSSILPGSGSGFTAASIAYLDGLADGRGTRDGLTAGAQVGYNWQVAPTWVLGLEADFNALSSPASFTGSGTTPGGTVITNFTNTLNPQWMATVRGRVGYAIDRSLLYATGGLAVLGARYDQTYSDNFPSLLVTSTSNSKAGWTLGAGWEYALTGNWTVKAEYLYSRFDHINAAQSAPVTPGFTDEMAGTANDTTVQIARVGFNYKFGAPVAASPASAVMPLKAVKAPVLSASTWYSDILTANSQISVDFTETAISYQEKYSCVNPFGAFSYTNNCQQGIFDEERTNGLPGVSGTISWMGNIGAIQNLYVMGTVSHINGDVNYLAGNGQMIQPPARVWNTEFRVGKGFELASSSMLTPYVGVGGNWWKRILNVSGGYEENYSHAYAGAGFLFQFAPISHLVASINGLVGSTFDAGMDLSRIPGGFPINAQHYALGNTIMYDAGLSFDYAFTHQLHGNVGFDYQHFGYKQSPVSVIDGSLEPTSTTDYRSIKIGLGYSFAPAAVAAKN